MLLPSSYFIPIFIYIIDYFIKIHINLFVTSICFTLIGFLVIGILKFVINKNKNPINSIIETILLGIIAATVAYSVGKILKNII